MCEDNLIESLKVEYKMVQLTHKNSSSMFVRDSSISSFFRNTIYLSILKVEKHHSTFEASCLCHFFLFSPVNFFVLMLFFQGYFFFVCFCQR